MSDVERAPSVGDEIVADNAGWTFSRLDEASFAHHLRRSIPFYDDGHDLVCRLSDFFVRDDSVVYDIGSGVGELLAALAARHRARREMRLVGIEVEPRLTEFARNRCAQFPGASIEEADVAGYEFQPNDLTVSYYCLQFVHPKFRQSVIDSIYEHLNWGGAFILFEKVRGPDARFQDILSTLYVDYKLEQAFTPDEIVAKTRSLKGVLEPFSTQGNLDLLTRAGFVDVMSIFRYLCFEGFLAIK